MEQHSVNKGKRKWTEEGYTQSAPNTDVCTVKRRKMAEDQPTTRRRREVTKPDTFASLYEVGKKLGKGSFGSVFAGRRVSDGLQVAIKIASKVEEVPYVQSPVEPKSVPVEVALMQTMSLPPTCNGIIQLIEWFDEPEQYIIIMERPDPCMNLKSFLELFGGCVREETAHAIMLQVVEAVVQCHKRGVLHSDIKLEKLLIKTDTLEVKFIDFGCGDWYKKSAYDEFAGTFEYYPPEFHLKGKYHGTPLTVWSLGILLFRVVSGHLPFTKHLEIIEGQLDFSSKMSDECCYLIRWCLQHEAKKRPNLQQIKEHSWFQSSRTS